MADYFLAKALANDWWPQWQRVLYVGIRRSEPSCFVWNWKLSLCTERFSGSC